MEVVHGRERVRQNLFGPKEVRYIRLAEMCAGITLTTRVQRAKISPVFRIRDIDAALCGIQRAVPCLPCRCDTVECIDAIFYPEQN